MSRSLPINRKMFFRYSMVECTQDYCSDRQAILTLLRDQKTVRERLQALVRRIHADSIGVEVSCSLKIAGKTKSCAKNSLLTIILSHSVEQASFDCMPESADVIENGMHPSSASRTTADCRRWNPEMPEFVGLYHAYVKGFNKETRTHRLFLVTSGGCSAMCDNYFNLSVDVRNDMSCRQVLDSEETWFLRKVSPLPIDGPSQGRKGTEMRNGQACQRNNARVLASVAMEFGLAIPMVSDPYAYEPCSIASCTTETLQYDMVGSKDGRIAFMNKCVETMSCRNGVLCSMHPSEGVWLFKGPLQTNSSMTIYGGKRVQARPICTGG